MTLDERLHHVIKVLNVAERVTGGSFFEERQAVEEARALLRANLTPGFMCGACGVFTGTAKENRLALAAAAALSLAGLGYLAWQEYKRPGYILPFRTA